MIKKFSVLYVGHIALDNVGRDGTPADARRYPNERLVEGMAMAEDVAHAMDELGYDTLWMAEAPLPARRLRGHSQPDPAGTYLATQTRRVKFGCAFNVTQPGIRSAWPRTTPWPISHPRASRPGRWARVSDARGGDARRTIPRRRSQRRAVPRADGDPVQGLQRGGLEPQGHASTRCQPRSRFAAISRRS